MVGVFVLHPKMSGSSDNLNKTRMVHVILSITDTWRGVDKPILETPIFIQQKKKKKKKYATIGILATVSE